jgi:Tat protein secretion system quality control protein TatD with DNase activity
MLVAIATSLLGWCRSYVAIKWLPLWSNTAPSSLLNCLLPIQDCDDATLGVLRQLAADPRCVAIGECGLDFNRNFSPPDVQELWFAAQVDMAEELGMPLFMHCRDAGERFAAILR